MGLSAERGSTRLERCWSTIHNDNSNKTEGGRRRRLVSVNNAALKASNSNGNPDGLRAGKHIQYVDVNKTVSVSNEESAD